MLWDEPKIFFLERRYFFSIILSEFLKNRVALHCKNARMLTHVGVFAVDFSRIDTGKTVCFLVSGGLSAVLSRVVYVNYSSVSIRP